MTDSMAILSGSGTEQDPYLITTAEDLQAINQELDAHYELSNDIDAEVTSEWKDGSGFEPIGAIRNEFTGIFNGKNYEIRNLCINRPDEDRVGLFGSIGKTGQVKNLGLVSPGIEGKEVVGGLAAENLGEIESSYTIKANVLGDKFVGGLVGWNHTDIGSSYIVRANVSGIRGVGGLIGMSDGKIGSSYTVKANVSGDKKVGGLLGWNTGKLELFYSVKSDVSGDKNVGGLVGWNINEPLDSSFILSRTDKTLENADLVLSRGNHTILYIVETRKLYVQIGDEIYSGGEVSPVKMQSLLEDTELVEITEEFKTSVVTATYKNK